MENIVKKIAPIMAAENAFKTCIVQLSIIKVEFYMYKVPFQVLQIWNLWNLINIIHKIYFTILYKSRIKTCDGCSIFGCLLSSKMLYIHEKYSYSMHDGWWCQRP